MARQKTSNTLQDLAATFFSTLGVELGLYDRATRKLREDAESSDIYQANLEILAGALKQGWSAKALREFCYARYKGGDRVALLSEILPEDAPGYTLEEGDNLLSKDAACRHPALRLNRPPAFTITDRGLSLHHEGESVPREKFTLRDLTEYFFRRMPSLAQTNRGWDQVMRQLRSLVRKTDGNIELALETIDLAAARCDSLAAIRWDDLIGEAEEAHRIATG